MKSILILIHPEWVEKITSGKKTIEVRKTAPKESPFKAYIYETKGKKIECGFHFEDTGITLREKYVFGMHKARIIKHYRDEGRGKVIGEFICDKVYLIKNQGSRFPVADEEQSVTNEIARQSCLDYDDMVGYLGNKDGYGWHISDLKIYDKPKELSKFWGRKNCIAADTVECWNCFATCLEIEGKHYQPLTRPPQSWQYVEELEK